MKKKMFSLLIFLSIFVSIITNITFNVKTAQEDAEKGTISHVAFRSENLTSLELAADGYYEISNADEWYQFVSISASNKEAKVRLVADIDFTGVSNLLDYKITTFNGIFDGQGCTVKNINSELTSNFALFYTIGANGVIKNIKFDNISITSTSNYVYIQLISNTNNGEISNIDIDKITLNSQYTTTLAYKNYGTINDVTISNIDLDAKYSTGSIVSTNYADATISQCNVSSGSVTVYNATSYSDVYGGGIVGINNGFVKNCSNGTSVSVTGDRNVGGGGIVGHSTAPKTNLSTVSYCSNTGDVTTNDLNLNNGYDYAGGITGSQSSGNFDIIECYNTGNITAIMVAGGISGSRPYASTNVINNCWNSGTIKTTTTDTSYGSGGISGDGGNGIIKNCLNVGDVLTGAYGAPLVATGSGTQPGVAKLVNSYAMDGCVKGVTDTTTLSGSLYYGYDENGERISSGVTETQLADGTILTALNAGNDEPVWGQVEGGDHPILLNNNNLSKTQISIQGATAANKVYDGTANVGYTGTITTTPNYDVSKITIAYTGILLSGENYESNNAPVEVGEYVVIFSIPSSDLQYTGELRLSFKITKKLPDDVLTPTAKNAIVGSTLIDIILETGWQWADSSLSLDEKGTFEYDVYYSLTDEQIANYDYSTINGFNLTTKRIERKVTVTVTNIQIDFENCDDIKVLYGSTINISGTPVIEDISLVEDTDYQVEIYTIDETGKVGELLVGTPTNIGKYLVFINVNNTIYDNSYEIIDGEPTTIIGENAETLSTTYKCVYTLEITNICSGGVDEAIIEELEEAIKNLEAALELKADKTELAKAITDLTALIEAAKGAAETANDELQTLLEGKLSTAEAALNKSISDLESKLDQAIIDLEKADKEDAEALAKAITDLTALIEAAKGAAETANDELQTLLEGKLSTAEAALNKSISDLESKLDQAIIDLKVLIETTDNENDEVMKAAVENLISLIEALEIAGKKSDEALKVELEAIEKELNAEIEALKQALKEAIEKASKENTELEEKLNDADEKVKEALLDEIKSSIILPIVIGCISVAGNIALVVYILIKRKK